jgi:uncharacterized protein (DUF305 family)
MINKQLLSGISGFLIGGLLVSVAYVTFDKPNNTHNDHSSNSMSLDDMTADISTKKGDAYDKAFITNMIVHHQGAIAMARLSSQNAKHDEIKTLSNNIISAQDKEISQMKQWQKNWGYNSSSMTIEGMNHDDN